jgi:membrane fusion protein
MSDQPLFRSEALEAHQPKWLGGIILIRPISYTVMAWFAAGCAVLILLFLVWGSYTKRSTVVGQLLPDAGMVKVYTPQVGVIVQKLVSEGQEVNKGDPLFVLSSERQGSQGAIQAAISAQVVGRRQSLVLELEKTRNMHREERLSLQKRIDGLDAEGKNLDNQIEVQKSKAQLAEEAASRYRKLLADEYISRDQLQQKETEFLDQRSRLFCIEPNPIEDAPGSVDPVHHADVADH